MEYACELPELVNEINAVNPDALVIIVGMYNPMADAVIALDENTTLDISEYVDYLVKGVAVHGIAYSMLTGNAIYVDAPAVETGVTGTTVGLDNLLPVLMTGKLFPTDNGHEYIKNQILNALDLSTNLLGDVNDDGVVDILDLMRLANHFANGAKINEKNSDVNCDGVVDILDLMRLANYFAGLAKLG